MDPLLRTAVVTAGWALIQVLIGYILLGRKGRPYKIPIVALHLLVFLFIAAGWFYTVQALTAAPGNHALTWTAEAVMGLAIVLQLVGGFILVVGRKVPAPKKVVLIHQIGMWVVLGAALVGIVCLLLGV
jgi:hypothetical protein